VIRPLTDQPEVTEELVATASAEFGIFHEQQIILNAIRLQFPERSNWLQSFTRCAPDS
jgi:hypothetical protein